MKSIAYLKIVFRSPVRVIETAVAKEAIVAADGVELVRILEEGDDRLEVRTNGSASFEVPWHMVASAMRVPTPEPTVPAKRKRLDDVA